MRNVYFLSGTGYYGLCFHSGLCCCVVLFVDMGSPYEVQAGLELQTLLPWPPEGQDCRCAPPQQSYS